MQFKIEPSPMVNASALVRVFNGLARLPEPAAPHVGLQPTGFRGDLVVGDVPRRTVSGIPRGRAVVAAPSRHLGQGITALWAMCARSPFSSGDNPGRRCSRSEPGATLPVTRIIS